MFSFTASYFIKVTINNLSILLLHNNKAELYTTFYYAHIPGYCAYLMMDKINFNLKHSVATVIPGATIANNLILETPLASVTRTRAL